MSTLRTIPGLRETVPRSTPWQPFEQARDALEGLIADQGAAEVDLNQLRAEHEAAVAGDRRAFADSIRAGTAPPSDKTVQKLAVQVEAKQRYAEALAIAITDAEAHFAATFQENRGAWATEQTDTVEATRKDTRKALASFEDACRQMLEASTLLRFVQTWEPGVRIKPARAGLIPGLLGTNHDPLSFDTVLAALNAYVAGDAQTEETKPNVLAPGVQQTAPTGRLRGFAS